MEFGVWVILYFGFLVLDLDLAISLVWFSDDRQGESFLTILPLRWKSVFCFDSWIRSFLSFFTFFGRGPEEDDVI